MPDGQVTLVFTVRDRAAGRTRAVASAGIDGLSVAPFPEWCTRQ